MKTIYVFLVAFFFGCGYSQSQRDLVVSPAGATVNESGHCVGLDCGNYGYGAGYGQWATGSAPYQGLAPSWGRFGAIEAYRAQNRWIMGPASGNGSGSHDPRLDRLVPHLRRMANAMCRNGTLTGDDCTSSRSTQASPAPAATPNSAPTQPAANSAPPATPAPQAGSTSQTATSPVFENAQEGAPSHQRRRPITADEFE